MIRMPPTKHFACEHPVLAGAGLQAFLSPLGKIVMKWDAMNRMKNMFLRGVGSADWEAR